MKGNLGKRLFAGIVLAVFLMTTVIGASAGNSTASGTEGSDVHVQAEAPQARRAGLTYTATDWASLVQAFQSADDGDSIELKSNIVMEDTIDIMKDITLKGNDFVLGTDAALSDPQFKIIGKNVVLEDVTLRGNQNTGVVGGGIYALNTDLTATNVTFEKIKTDHNDRSALYLSGSGDKVLTNCVFKDIEGVSGISIYMWGSAVASMRLEKCRFENNVSLSQFTGVPVYAGAVPLMEIVDCDFVNNTAAAGAVSSGNTSTLKISDSRFTGNTGTGISGAISLTTADLELYGCTFEGNSGRESGVVRAESSSESSIYIEDSKFTGNEAASNGGALVVLGSFKAEVVNSLFKGNQAGGDGGAIYLGRGASVSLTANAAAQGTTFEKNHAGKNGGAVYAEDYAKFTANYASFSGNTAGKGLQYPFPEADEYQAEKAAHDALIKNLRGVSTNQTALAYNNYDINYSQPVSPAPTIGAVTEGDTAVSGTGEPGATVRVTWPDGTTSQTAVAKDGTWTIPVPEAVSLKEKDTISAAQRVGDRSLSASAVTQVLPVRSETTTTTTTAPEVNDETGRTPGTPKTGDNAWFLGLAVLAIAGAAGIGLSRKRRAAQS